MATLGLRITPDALELQSLVPGVTQTFIVTIKVVFNGEHYQGGTEAVSDRVIIQADNGDIELPLRSVVPKADVVVAGDLMFGLLPMDSQATKVISIVNKGTAATNFKIDWDSTEPTSLRPNSDSAQLKGATAHQEVEQQQPSQLG
ncbi:uncharacterized protein HaLaN_06460 [Haematococcus lacustris]|uniref:Uncharacterized protein n=1 Tax=Haematococcus lacustris TaxID=44745 RepID=A0A699YNA9_HAELA|nr:uncharacterized protein HaLaN_06460 [Haematococcus lacustris]